MSSTMDDARSSNEITVRLNDEALANILAAQEYYAREVGVSISSEVIASILIGEFTTTEIISQLDYLVFEHYPKPGFSFDKNKHQETIASELKRLNIGPTSETMSALKS